MSKNTNQEHLNNFSKIAICIKSLDNNSGKCFIDEEFGFIKAPISIDPVDLFEFLEVVDFKILDEIRLNYRVIGKKQWGRLWHMKRRKRIWMSMWK